MTTSWRRTSVSLAAATILVLGACATLPTGRKQGCLPAQPGSRTIRFDNEGRERVHVYLVAQQREWSLGRVEPGATAKLRIPIAALTEQEFMRLAVIVGDRMTLRAARDPRTQLTIAQPALHVLSQRWSFAQGQLTSMGFSGSPSGGSCSAGAGGLRRA